MKQKILGSIIVLSGPSGVGKSTLTKRVRAELPELRFSVSCTTRPPRSSETNDVDYHFICEEEFSARLTRGDFVEHAKVFDRHYGTLKSEVLDIVEHGFDVLLDIDVQGAMQIRRAAEADPMLARCITLVFIAPPSASELSRRLKSRATDSAEQIELRLSKAAAELSHWQEYDFVVVNEQLENAAQQLIGLIRSLRLETRKSPRERFDE